MPQYGNTPTDCEDKLSGYFYAYAGERAVTNSSMSDTIYTIKMLASYFK